MHPLFISINKKGERRTLIWMSSQMWEGFKMMISIKLRWYNHVVRRAPADTRRTSNQIFGDYSERKREDLS